MPVASRYGQDSETQAALFAKRVNALVESLVEFPRSGRFLYPDFMESEVTTKGAPSHRAFKVERGRTQIVAGEGVSHGEVERLSPWPG
jgi:plasmid stabilization system protein ParE